MSKSKNSYARKAKKKGFLNGIATPLETKKDIPNSLMETGKDLVVGAIGGGAVGAALGRWSLAVGALVSSIGHYFENKLTTSLGLGMMSSGIVGSANGMGDTENKGTVEGIKERLNLFKDTLSQKFFIDKLKNLKKPSATVSPGTAAVGEVQYFSYPETTGELGEGLGENEHLTALNNLEKQIAESALQMKGIVPEENLIGEIEDNTISDIGEIGDIDFAAKNY